MKPNNTRKPNKWLLTVVNTAFFSIDKYFFSTKKEAILFLKDNDFREYAAYNIALKKGISKAFLFERVPKGSNIPLKFLIATLMLNDKNN